MAGQPKTRARKAALAKKEELEKRAQNFVPLGVSEERGNFEGPMVAGGEPMLDAEAEAWWKRQSFYYQPYGLKSGDGGIRMVRQGAGYQSRTVVPEGCPRFPYTEANAILRLIHCERVTPIVALVRVIGSDEMSPSWLSKNGCPDHLLPNYTGTKARARRELLEEMGEDDESDATKKKARRIANQEIPIDADSLLTGTAEDSQEPDYSVEKREHEARMEDMIDEHAPLPESK